MLRWLYHVLAVSDRLGDPYTPLSWAREGFVHCSFVDVVEASARLYFAPGTALHVLQIDPRGLDVRVATTPRGPMPHIYQPIPRTSIVRVLTLDQIEGAPDGLGEGADGGHRGDEGDGAG